MPRRLALLGALSGLTALACGAAAAQPATIVLEEVPFITTPDHVTVAMLQLAGVGPRDHVIDLGSGDGRIVITAARRFGARGAQQRPNGANTDPKCLDVGASTAALRWVGSSWIVTQGASQPAAQGSP